MRAAEIISVLAARLPQLTGDFTDDIAVDSLTQSAGVATVTTSAAHGLAVGHQVAVTGAKTPITVSSFTRSGTVGTIVTASNHDYTEGYQTVVETSGATEPEFNGSFPLLTVPNRRTVTVSMPDAGSTVATGVPLLLNGSNIYQSYNGLRQVLSVPSATTLTVSAPSSAYSPAAGTVLLRRLPRISGAVNFERALSAYTKQGAGKRWAFVSLGPVAASRSRIIDSDAADNIQRGNEYRQQLVHPVTVYVVSTVPGEYAARAVRDDMEDLLPVLCRCLLGYRPDSRLYVGAQSPLVFVGHDTIYYDGAVYAHGFDFSAVADLTFADTIGYSDDVAFRDIRLDMGVDTGTEIATADIDLDDVPL